MSDFKAKLRRLTVPASLVFAVAAGGALGGCSHRITGMDGMEDSGSGFLLFNQSRRELNEAAARANVLAAGQQSPIPVVRETAAKIGCEIKGETGDRLRRRDDWAKTSGAPSNCPK